MRLLGIETSTSVCGAAVAVDQKIVSMVEFDEKYVHAEKLLTCIEQALESAGIAPALLDGIAVSIGPGSFTGLRIGLSVAKGLAFSLDKPIVAVPTLEALAYRVIDEDIIDQSESVLAVLDARRNEVYCQLFEATSQDLKTVWEPRDVIVSELISQLADRRVVVIGDGSEKVMKDIGREGRAVREAPSTINRCSARSVALIGNRKLQRGETEYMATLEPYYIKEFHTKAQ
ncbi:MAG: tRNA (adenosine(37)-N6)-threonylcarbamoyltransferase complex dimerization subunit type 1 TsaB [Bacteroidota bacterium]